MKTKVEITDIKEMELSDMIVPTGQKVLLQLIQESNEHIPGITRLNKEVEIYAKVASVGPRAQDVKPGDWVLTRPGITFQSFKIFDKEYTMVYDTDLIAVLHESILSELSTDKIKGVTNNNGSKLIN